MRKIFKVFFNPNYTHYVGLLVFKTQKLMAADLIRGDHRYERPRNPERYKGTEAGCRSFYNLYNNCTSELSFCREHLTTENIIHECVHAAYHHATVLGYKVHTKDFEEFVALDSGRLSVEVMKCLKNNRIKIR